MVNWNIWVFVVHTLYNIGAMIGFILDFSIKQEGTTRTKNNFQNIISGAINDILKYNENETGIVIIFFLALLILTLGVLVCCSYVYCWMKGIHVFTQRKMRNHSEGSVILGSCYICNLIVNVCVIYFLLMPVQNSELSENIVKVWFSAVVVDIAAIVHSILIGMKLLRTESTARRHRVRSSSYTEKRSQLRAEPMSSITTTYDLGYMKYTSHPVHTLRPHNSRTRKQKHRSHSRKRPQSRVESQRSMATTYDLAYTEYTAHPVHTSRPHNSRTKSQNHRSHSR